MRQNYETCLVVDDKVILVPYRPQHVPRYHQWMKDPALLEATGSEPLSYQEECEMQQSWRDDDLKCTFIVHYHPTAAAATTTTTTTTTHSSDDFVHVDDVFHVDEHLEEMIGDVNLFLSELERDDEEEDNIGASSGKSTSLRDATESSTSTEAPAQAMQAEIDIMISEKGYQGRGLGTAAVCTMLLYGSKELDIQRFFCRINEDNVASIQLFSRIGFQQCNYAACFKQIEMELIKSKVEMVEICESFGVTYRTVHCPLFSDANNEGE